MGTIRKQPRRRTPPARVGYGLERLESRQLLTVAPSGKVSPAASTVSPSGDYRIDAVLGGSKWDVTNVTYSFYDGGSYYGSEVSPTPVSTAVRDNVRTILSTIISPLVNLTFTEVPDSPTSYGMIRYLCSTSASYAYAYYPDGSNVGGDVVLRTSFDVANPSDTNSFRNGIGSHGFQSIIHETCHALGLKHPGDYNGSGTGDPPFLPLGQDNGDNSLMSYNFSSGKEPASPMPFDVLALGYIYGAKTSTRGADTTYTFTATDVWTASDGSSAGSASMQSKNTLWDGGGTDTFDVSRLPAAASGYRIDIGAGGWVTPTASYNSVKYNASTGSPTKFTSGTTYAATNFGTRLALAGTTIENVIVSGSSDSIFVNAAANRISGYTPGTATGADTITSADQADTLDLAKFLESAVVKSQVGNDLVLYLGGSTGTVTVKDYYAVGSASRINIIYATPPSITIATTDANKPEGTGGGTTPFTFTVTRSGGLSAASTVQWAVAGTGLNQANADDFGGGTFPTGTLSFSVGEDTKTITINVSADTTIEADEGFTVTLSTPTGATLGSIAQATGMIRNDDFPAFTIAATAADKAEGTGGSPTPFTFTVTRPSAATGAASVAWAVTGSGVNPANAADFAGGVLPSGTLAFATGETSKTITVNVAADAVIESNEEFSVSLASPSGATLGSPASVSGLIRNDDLPSLSIGDAEVVEGNSGTTSVTLTITLSAAAFGPVTVAYATLDGTATAAGNDYVVSDGTVTFAPGETSKTISLAVRGDTAVESDEAFGVRLASPVGASIARSTGTVTIRNDDYRSTISVAAADATKAEGDRGLTPFTFTVNRSGIVDRDVTVPWSVTGSGLYRADEFDFGGGVLPSGTIRLAAGRRSQTLTINVRCDKVAEFDEQFTVTLGNPLGGFDRLDPSANFAIGTIKNDDPGTPRPAAAAPAQGQLFAAFAASGGPATPQAIAAQAFATLADTAGSSGTSTAKRNATTTAIRA